MTDETLFAAALEQPTPEARAAFLAGACDDPEQRARVERLLAAHDQAGGFRDPGSDLDEEGVTRAAPENTSATRTFPGSQPDPDVAAFLTPPGRPDSLGRIGHYDVLEVLGKGGFGIVFRALDDKLRRVVAVKVLAPELAVTSPARKRFLREARSAAAIRHENVVQVYGVEEHPLPFLVMEYVPGETLAQRIVRNGPLPADEVTRIGRQIADGLAAAHATGLVHRDIKPANVLTEGEPPRVKITDFGLARAADDASLSRSGAVTGTPQYMSPEQARGESLDSRSDLFSLGSLLYALLTGHPPFRAANALAVLKRVAEDNPRPIREQIPETPEWLCDLVEQLLAKAPAERPQSAREVAERLAAGLELRPTAGRPGRRPRSLIPLLVLSAVTLVVVAAGVCGWWAVNGQPPTASATATREAPGRPDPSPPTGERTTRPNEVQPSTPPSASPNPLPATGDTTADRRAAEYVLSVGGNVVLRDRKNQLITPQTPKDIPSREFQVYEVRLNWSRPLERVTEAGLAAFDGCTGIHTLFLQGASFTDASLRHFRECKQLRLLSIQEAKVTDTGLEHFAGCTHLTDLRLANVNVIGPGLVHFAGCQELTRLHLVITKVTDEGLAHFRDCTKLEQVALWHAPITNAGLRHFENWKSVYHVMLSDTDVTDAGLGVFRGHDALKELLLTNTEVGDDGLKVLTGCKSLKRLELGGTRVSDAGLKTLTALPALQQLSLDRTAVTDAGLVHLIGARELAWLELDETVVSDVGLGHLSAAKNLKNLTLRKCKVTQAGVDQLAAARPDCRIEWDGKTVEPKK